MIVCNALNRIVSVYAPASVTASPHNWDIFYFDSELASFLVSMLESALDLSASGKMI